jgi:RNA polymerase sigma factor (sigma-70 family)
VAESLHAVVSRAVEGDRAALDELVLHLQDRIYNLALRMLWHPQDAEDATQEILLKIVVNLGSFRGESAVTTWALRIASNHLVHTRRSRAEAQELSFSAFGEDLQRGLDPPNAPADRPDQALLEQEVKIGCTHAMLLCLDREHRLAYILGEVFELPGDEAASALGISAAAYRKRLSRARTRLREFMKAHCGLVSDLAPCRCSRRITPAIASGRVDPDQLLFVQRKSTHDAVIAQSAEMDELHRIASIYRANPDCRAPVRLAEAVRTLLESRRFRLLD